jgi:hypothetical protein
MATGGTAVSGRRKGTICVSRYLDTSQSGALNVKNYLVGNDNDDGYAFDTSVRITRLSWQASVLVLDDTETLTINVYKGTEAAGLIFTSGALSMDAAAPTFFSGTDTTAATEALAHLLTSDDLIATAEFSAGSTTAEVELCVQIDYEYDD